MSFDETVKTVANRIRRQDYIEVYAHHDADGIAAGAILCHAMLREGIRFRLRVCAEVDPASLNRDSASLLCDLGSGMENLPRETIVVDHHLPRFEGEFHANPRLSGIDGDLHLSAAGTAYLVACQMGDNRDLAGLVMPGIIGDGQDLAGKNLEIFNEGVGNGIIVPDRGLTLPGQDMPGRWLAAISPYLEGISGNEAAVAALVGEAQGDQGVKMDMLLTLAVLRAAPRTSKKGLCMLYGDTCRLQREVIEDAHTLAAVIDACGKSGNGDLGAEICLRSSRDVDRACGIAQQHRLRVIEAIRAVQTDATTTDVCEVQDASLASDLADVLARDRAHAAPLLVYVRSGDACRISARSPADAAADIGPVVRDLATACGGSGGGHRHRAGATIPCDRLWTFVQGWKEAFAA
jgi:nanoRNase/pAp phosphatase (c-di-AMP/oligoRNAs hydrolase)